MTASVRSGPPAGPGPWLERAVLQAERFVLRLQAHDAFGAAASIAFWFFLSLVPLLVLAGYLVGQVARVKGIDSLLGPLLDVLPGSAEGLVGKELERLARAGAQSIAPLGVLGFMWTASTGLHNLMDVFETAAQAERRAWWKQRVMALAWVAAALAAACALTSILVQTVAAIQPDAQPVPAQAQPQATARSAERSERSAGSRSAGASASPSASAGAPGSAASSARTHGALRRRVNKALHTPGEQLVATALLLLAGTAFLAGFYRFAVVHPKDIRRRIWPGAITAVASWLGVSWAFGAYAVSIADYALYYGGLAAVAVLLVWLYLTSLTLVVGAEVNAQLEGLPR